MSYDFEQHRRMALDLVRNRAYADALRQVVTPDSVVLDLGAGLGTLGMLAAKLGARRVYLVEPGDVVSTAKQLVHANGLSDRVHVLQGKIEDVELPESVDVIASVMTGNFLLSEDLLPSLFHARDKYLVPGGHLVPSKAVMEVVPAQLPTAFEKNLTCWTRDHLGIDFSIVRDLAANHVYFAQEEFWAPTPLADACDLFELDFRSATTTNCRASIETTVTTTGTCHGWLGWFRMKLGDAWLSTAPSAPRVHWSPAYLPIDPPIHVTEGQSIGLEVMRPPFGDWTWTTAHGSKRTRHSTFFAHPMSADLMHSHLGRAMPVRGVTGDRALHVLHGMNGSKTLNELAQELQQSDALQFSDLEQAKAYVQRCVRAYGAKGPSDA